MLDKTLVLCRGIRGSGKSTLAETIAPDANFSADQWFEANGGYDPRRIEDAHSACRESVSRAMTNGVPVIAVHNTFTRNWEMKPYHEIAQQFGYEVFVVVCENDFGTIHGGGPEVNEKMKARWEPRFFPKESK